jgi:hypothetical protein
MRTIHEPARETPVLDEVDVLVVGGGPAGYCAAVAAARQGARTALVERYGCLGGLATGGLVLYMDGIFDTVGRRVMGGLVWETMQRLEALGGLAQDSPTRLHVDSEWLQVAADALCHEAGVQLWFHAWAVGAYLADGRVAGAILETKSGRQAILARVCVDATGDGDLAASAGAAYDMGHQRIGLNLKVGGVDRERWRAFTRDEPQRARALQRAVLDEGGVLLRPNTTPHSDIGVYWINILGLDKRNGTTYHDEGDLHAMFEGQLSAVDVRDLSYVQYELRRRIARSLAFYKANVPGFEDVRLLAIAPQLGVRESRRIRGMYELTEADVRAQRVFDDTIGLHGLGFAGGGLIHLPYRSLVPETVDGLLTSGRCVSTDHWTMQAVRLIPPAMVTGEAAGVAAALSVQAGCQPRALPTERLRGRLAETGVLMAGSEALA